MTRTPDLPASYQLVRLDSVDSTNEEARRLAASEAAVDGTLVWALSQTAGKGRRGRAWESPGGNLYCSILLRPDCAAAKAAQLSFVAAVAVVEAVTDIAGPALEVRCKWPNDVLVGGRKISGILLESEAGAGDEVEWVVVGVGVNVAHHPR